MLNTHKNRSHPYPILHLPQLLCTGDVVNVCIRRTKRGSRQRMMDGLRHTQMHLYPKQKSKANKVMLHEIQLFLNPSLYPPVNKCFLPLFQTPFRTIVIEKQTWYLISKRRAIYSDRFHKNMLSRNDVTNRRKRKNRFKSALAVGCLVVARP